jgi:hypothetical protein
MPISPLDSYHPDKAVASRDIAKRSNAGSIFTTYQNKRLIGGIARTTPGALALTKGLINTIASSISDQWDHGDSGGIEFMILG